ncbi:MAG: low molecular weight phosphotyrosine protein phosphatase [Treponema sp.]|nr:low molecular weight phosphotyrosine protein phosphatase [Treponema sp.]
MTKILFICHGNICRSPMAEFVMKELVRRAGLEDDFLIESAATSREELGNDMHYGTRTKLREMGIPFSRRAARQIRPDDYDRYDYLVAMDDENLYYMNRCWGGDPKNKIRMLLSFAGKDRDIADPWYTGNFDQTYEDVLEGCQAFLSSLRGA